MGLFHPAQCPSRPTHVVTCHNFLEFQFCKMKRILEMSGYDLHNGKKCTSCHRTAHLKMLKMASVMLYVSYRDYNNKNTPTEGVADPNLSGRAPVSRLLSTLLYCH